MNNVVRVMVVMVLALGGAVVSGAASPATAAYGQSASSSWVPDDTVFAIARAGNRVYIGGSFTSLRNPGTGESVARDHVAALDATTGELVRSWNPGADGVVRAIDVGGNGVVYLGGSFTHVASRYASRLAAVTSAGDPVPGWSATADDSVLSVLVTGGRLYAGGRFGNVNGVSRPRLVRLDPADGSVVTTFNARVTGGRVRTLAPSTDGTNLLVGGLFTALAGQPRGFVGAVDSGDGTATGWAPAARCDDCYVLDLVADGGSVYAAVAGPGGRAVSWSLSTGGLQWSRSGDGDVQAIDVEDGVVYAGGHFGPLFDGHTRHQLVALDSARGTLLSYTLPFTGGDQPGIWAVLADATGLRIGGGFQLSGNPARRYAALAVVASPPSAPRGVTAAVAGDAVRVTWSAPASDGGGAVERYEVSSSPRADRPTNQVCSTQRLSCDVPIGSGGLVEGRSYSFTVRAVNAGGTGPASSPSPAVVADGTGPLVTVAGKRWGTVMSGSWSASWSGTDPSGVASYRVRERSSKGQRAYSSWVEQQTTATTWNRPLVAGETACIRVRGVDGVGNVGPLSRKVCRTAPVDDRAFAAKGKVKRRTGSKFYEGTVTRLVGAHSRLRSPRVRADRARLVATSCASCGKVRVFYGSQRVAVVSLRSATVQHRRVFKLPDPSGVRRIVLAPTRGSKVLVDGLSLRRR